MIGAHDIAISVEQEIRALFAGSTLPDQMRAGYGLVTTALKEKMGKLGWKHNFLVAASGLPGAQEGEWLYDMVWFTLDNGFLSRIALVLESELNPDLTIDGDFQKLVQARADIRVWVSCSRNEAEEQEQLENCKRQAMMFPGACVGDIYIFVIDNWTSPRIKIESFVVNSLARG